MEQIVVNNVHYKKDKKEKEKNTCYVTYQEKRLPRKITSNDNIYVI